MSDKSARRSVDLHLGSRASWRVAAARRERQGPRVPSLRAQVRGPEVPEVDARPGHQHGLTTVDGSLNYSARMAGSQTDTLTAAGTLATIGGVLYERYQGG